MFHKIALIINPASGQQYPILFIANEILQKAKVPWDVYVTQKSGDGKRFVEQAINTGVDVVAVYGGDGTVMEVAEALASTNTPLAIIPGGTANIMAHELSLPLDPALVIQMLTDPNPAVTTVDMGKLVIQTQDKTTERLFLLRLSIGFLAQMVNQTDRESKSKLGKFAYMLSLAQTVTSPENSRFRVTIDDQELLLEGVSLVIANAGKIGVGEIKLTPSIFVQDGELDLMLIRSTDLGSLVSLTTGILIQQPSTVNLSQWKGKSITVKTSRPQLLMCDDDPYEVTEFSVEIQPNLLTVMAAPEFINT